jgi:hypothetical protein
MFEKRGNSDWTNITFLKGFKLYRNLHRLKSKNKKPSISVQTYNLKKKSWQVIGYIGTAKLNNCSFKINENGRKKAVTEKCRNVHAMINCEKISIMDNSDIIDIDSLKEISYNPFKCDFFYYKCNGLKCEEKYNQLLLINNKIYLENKPDL